MKLFVYLFILNTRSDLDEAIVLDEDGVTGQVAMDDGGITWVEITAGQQQQTRVHYFPSFSCDHENVGARDQPKSWQDLRAPSLPSLSEAHALSKDLF